MSIPGPDRKCSALVAGFWSQYVLEPMPYANKSRQGGPVILSTIFFQTFLDARFHVGFKRNHTSGFRILQYPWRILSIHFG
jgi:hypothetical protein